MADEPSYPRLVQVVLDTTNARRLAEFYRELLGLVYRPGDEETVIPTAGLSTGSRMWLHYMSVVAFDEPGDWDINFSGMAHSDDDGLTWSAPTKVNQTPAGTFTDQAFEPTVHVNSAGVVAVTYYDFRNDVSGDGALTTDHWIVHSHDGGATWTEDHLGGPFDMHQAPYARGYFVGDYQGLDAQGNVFRPLFTLASPSVGSFPNPNPTDVFTNTAG